ncbi:hypothetical protein N9192_00550 [Akkermansiaceae bacterium]|nr:hypothetical protein [Akkermansiaceae bacterium]MDB4507990.1 hypothetical protein [Akkermansiaceae bacterium]MDB4541365.1 hypothetical protein [Akkermansiaceae bacterium]
MRFLTQRGRATNPSSKGNPQAAYRTLIRTKHQLLTNNSVESVLEKALHLVMQHAGNGRHERDDIFFPFTKG